MPLHQQEPALLPVSGKGSTQRQLQIRLISLLPAPEDGLRLYQRGHKSLLSLSIDTLEQGKLAVQGGQNSTAQGQASWEGAVMAGATYVD